jgi:hypothetical protein
MQDIYKLLIYRLLRFKRVLGLRSKRQVENKFPIRISKSSSGYV